MGNPKRGTTDSQSAFAFGRAVSFLTIEQTQTASPTDRLQSVWPFIVRQGSRFYASLKPSERVAFSLDDILHEIAGEILTKDESWDPARGTYAAFAGALVRNQLLTIRERAHTVESPKNSSCRVKEYQTEAAEGSLSGRKAATYKDILRTFAQPEGEEVAHGRFASDDDVLDDIVGGEEDSGRVDVITDLVRRLDPKEAFVIGRLFGLWGQTPRDTSDILGPGKAREVISLRNSALRKMRTILYEEGISAMAIVAVAPCEPDDEDDFDVYDHEEEAQHSEL